MWSQGGHTCSSRGSIHMHIQAAVDDSVGSQNEEDEIERKGVENYNRRLGNRFHQNTLYACLKFPNNKKN